MSGGSPHCHTPANQAAPAPPHERGFTCRDGLPRAVVTTPSATTGYSIRSPRPPKPTAPSPTELTEKIKRLEREQARLLREQKQLQMECEILKRAEAFVAKRSPGK